MPYELFGKPISGRFTIPSGIVTTNVPTLRRIAQDVPEVGILTTKSIGREPREGNREPIVHCYESGTPGTFINAVGLRNPGADKFAEELASLRLPADKFLLASVVGATPDDMVYVVERLEPHVDGFELNFSCPHSPGHGTAMGHDPGSVTSFTRTVRDKTKKPIFAKLSPNHPNIAVLGVAAMRGGADGITAINTVGPKVYEIDGHPILTSPIGGSLSGTAINHVRRKAVKELREAVGSGVPFIIMGGISCAGDVREYADDKNVYVGVGTALAGMSTKTLAKYFAAFERDMLNGTNEAEQYLMFNCSGHKKFRVRRNERLAEDLSLVTLDGDFEIKPGQFVFVWLPGIGEKPYSLIESEPARIAVQVRKRADGSDGKFSKALVDVAEGSELYLRGPHGNPVELGGIGYAVLVGGGMGIAAIYPIAAALSGLGADFACLLGAKDRAHLVYAKEFSRLGHTFYSTDDGSYGNRGFVTDLLGIGPEELRLTDGTTFFNCGPTPMIRRAEEIEARYVPGDRVFSSEEELTMCGYGLCGTSAREDGLRRCVDGYFMNPVRSSR